MTVDAPFKSFNSRDFRLFVFIREVATFVSGFMVLASGAVALSLGAFIL